MQSLVVKISNPDTVHAIAEAAKRQGTTPEAAALELLETAVLAQRPFEEIVEPRSSRLISTTKLESRRRSLPSVGRS